MPKAKGHISQLQGDALTVATQLHGQILHALNFVSTLAAWPTGANKHIKEIEILVDEYLERTVVNEKKLEALKQADFAKLISLWYPDAQWPELKVATAYTVLWIFVWDDEVDTGGLADESLAQEYYQNSIAYARYILGLDEHFHTTNGDANVVIPPHTNMTLFVDFGSVLREKTDIQQRQRFFDNLKDFKEQVGVEHSYRISGSMPSLSDYMVIRMGSVGCTPQIALTEIRLPESVMGCDAMTALWGQTTRICIVLNDLYSAQKEMAQGSLLNIVPIIFHDIKDTGQKCLSMISQELDRILRDAMEKFELAARELEYMAPRRSQLNEDILKFVKWCRYYVMACLHWTLESHRYGMIKCTNADGTLSIPF